VKILLANKFFFRNGGSEVVLFQERDFLLHAGHEVVDFSMQDGRNIESPYAAHFANRQDYRRGGKFGKIQSAISLVHSPEAVRKIEMLIEKTRPDIVHCHNIYHQLTPSIIGAAKKLGVPVVLTLHDYKLVCPTYVRLRDGRGCSDCLGGDFFNVVKHRCADGSLGKSTLLYAEAMIQKYLGNYEKVDVMIAPSRFMQEAISHRIPAGRTRLLYNGVNTSTIRMSGADEGYALYLGRLSSEKGVRTLLEAHATSDKNWPLVVAGTGPLEESLKRQYNKAKFIGHVSGAQLHEVIDRSAVVVVPSEWYENCPMSILEAMAYGKPVVGSRMGGIPELVVDGETGLLFDAGSVEQLQGQLNKLMLNFELRQSMAHRARLRAEQEFSLDKHNSGLMAIYESLANSK
jgi:glycosyltransferase involved in cell wall biosynthesis